MGVDVMGAHLAVRTGVPAKANLGHKTLGMRRMPCVSYRRIVDNVPVVSAAVYAVPQACAQAFEFDLFGAQLLVRGQEFVLHNSDLAQHLMP